jgi:hypothetical protein
VGGVCDCAHCVDRSQASAAAELGWGFRIRLKKSLRVYRVSKPCLSMGRLMPAKGHALAHLEYLLPFLWFEPGPDPYPAIASKTQAAKPIATIFGPCLEITYELSVNKGLPYRLGRLRFSKQAKIKEVMKFYQL